MSAATRYQLNELPGVYGGRNENSRGQEYWLIWPCNDGRPKSYNRVQEATRERILLTTIDGIDETCSRYSDESWYRSGTGVSENVPKEQMNLILCGLAMLDVRWHVFRWRWIVCTPKGAERIRKMLAATAGRCSIGSGKQSHVQCNALLRNMHRPQRPG